MDLQQLQAQCTQQLLTNRALQLKDVKQFSIPLHTVELCYEPIVRTPMDILMKMMLLTFERTPITDVTLVADILFVERLFVQDLTDKMLKLGLLTLDGHYKLTAKGKQQLDEGIFEQALQEERCSGEYSVLHDDFLEGDLDAILDLEDYPPLISYVDESLGELHTQNAIAYAQNMQPASEQGEPPRFVTSLVAYESVQLNDSPCLQFILYDTKQAHFVVRVFNVFTNRWDETLEQLIEQHERAAYRTQYPL